MTLSGYTMVSGGANKPQLLGLASDENQTTKDFNQGNNLFVFSRRHLTARLLRTTAIQCPWALGGASRKVLYDERKLFPISDLSRLLFADLFRVVAGSTGGHLTDTRGAHWNRRRLYLRRNLGLCLFDSGPYAGFMGGFRACQNSRQTCCGKVCQRRSAQKIRIPNNGYRSDDLLSSVPNPRLPERCVVLSPGLEPDEAEYIFGDLNAESDAGDISFDHARRES